MREAEVVQAFCAWLESDGWKVDTEVEWVDVVAERGDERLVAEAKGHTTSPGLDIDTMYGQILRRIATDPRVRYALVVPERHASKVLRVSSGVRSMLHIEVYGVDDDGTVITHD